MKSQNILLLGGTGFVGKYLLNRLYQKQLNIHVVARNAHTLPKLAGVHYYADLLDNPSMLGKILPCCQKVVHLVSNSTPGSSYLQPSFEGEKNILPTLRFLEILQQYPKTQLIYFSSGGAVYGNPETQLVSENAPLLPQSYYGAGKAALEKFIIAFCQQLQRSAVILRPANLYGPGQPYRSGFGIIPTIFHTVISKKPLPILGGGEVVRDYLYISDLIDLCIKLIEETVVHNSVKIYNVGSGRGYTLNQLCLLIEKVTNTKIIRQYQPSRPVDIKQIVLDCRHIYEDYHWAPKVDLPTGLAITWEWFKSHNHR